MTDDVQSDSLRGFLDKAVLEGDHDRMMALARAMAILSGTTPEVEISRAQERNVSHEDRQQP